MTSKTTYRILLAEDEENFGSVLKNYLELSDYIVTLCTDGNQGLISFKNNIYDLCILDVMMPVRDGFSLATEIRKMNTAVPLIFLTAKKLKELFTELRKGAHEAAFHHYDALMQLWQKKSDLGAELITHYMNQE